MIHDFVSNFPDEDALCRTDTNDVFEWTHEMDAQVVTWATQQPLDWQFGGKCEVYCWGNFCFLLNIIRERIQIFELFLMKWSLL